MAVKDIRSNLEQVVAFNAVISTDTTTNGAIIDTADYDNGVMFCFACPAYTDGTYTPVIQEGDNAALSDASSVADANLIGTEAGAALSAATAQADTALNTIGVFGTKRYLRVQIVSASTSSGATITVIGTKAPEVMPDVE